MQALKKHIYDEKNGLDYILIGDYYFPVLRLPEETRPIGRWGRMHREYLEQYQHGPIQLLALVRQALDVFGGSQRAGAGADGMHDYPDEGNGERYRGVEGPRPYGVGGGNEQDLECC